MLNFLFTFILSASSSAKVVLIDPGHGGVETGAVAKLSSKNIYEKDLSLRLAKKVKDRLSKVTTVYLTRSLDRAVSLQERADMAEMIKADLFISLHFNSSSDKKGDGFELYYLDNNSDAASKKVEKTENDHIKGEDPTVNQILIDLVIQQTVTQSKKLALKVHENIKPVLRDFKIDDRGIKPGLFYVLALSKRPGLLIEGGFMSETNELKKISQEKYLDQMAKAISQGIYSFIKSERN